MIIKIKDFFSTMQPADSESIQQGASGDDDNTGNQVMLDCFLGYVRHNVISDLYGNATCETRCCLLL